MLEIRPKVDPLSTEGLMIYFAECLQKFCEEKQGCKACSNCVFYRPKQGCSIGAPEYWGMGEKEE